MPPMLVLDPTADMLVSREEIFGPVLPIRTYRAIDDAIDHVNAGDRPLALYYFGPDAPERDRVLARTISGGVSPVVLGERDDQPLLGAVTLETLGMMLDPLKRRILRMRLMLAGYRSRLA